MNRLEELSADQVRHLMDVASGGLVASGDQAAPPVNDRDNAIIALVRQKVSEGERAKWPLIKKSALNKEYYADNQLAAWNPRKRQIVRAPQIRGGAGANHRVFHNFFKPTTNAIVAHFLSTRPQIIIKPGAADERIIEAARMAQKVVADHQWSRHGMQEIMARMVPALMLDGTSILKVVWNSRGGKFLGKKAKPIIMNGEPVQATELDAITGEMRPVFNGHEPVYLIERDSEGKPKLEDRWEGCAETHVIPMKNFFADPTCGGSFRNAGWCAEKYRVTQAYAYNQWGIRVTAHGRSAGGVESQYERTGAFGFNRRWDGQGSEDETIEVIEMHFSAGRYPLNNGGELVSERGMVVTICGDQIVDEATGDNPRDDGEFPYVLIPALRLPDELYGDTICNSLRILQNSLNKTISQITQANDLMGNPQWLLPNGCKMPDGDRTNKAGVHKRYEAGLGGVKPEIIPGVGVSPSVWRYYDSTKMNFQEVGGVRDGGLAGGAPGSIESGKALNVLVQSDMGKLASMGSEIGMGIERWGMLVMATIKQKWTARRLITVSGNLRVPEAFSFAGGDIHDSMELSVVPESTLPQTAAMRQAKADNLFDRQLIKPYDYLRRLGEDTAEDFTVESLNISNARVENAWAKKYGVIRTTSQEMEIEDHDLHVTEHDRELLNPELRRNPAKWDELKKHRDEHASMRDQAQQQELATAAQAAQALGPQGMPQADRSDIPAIPPPTVPPPGM